MKKLKISIFTGGSGNSEIIKILGNNKNIQINLLINGYDDGKSTKYIRETFTNMLGPSDFRKNTLNLLNEKNHNFAPFKFILNHRFRNYSEYLIFKKELNHNIFVKFNILNNLSHDKILDFKNKLNLLNKINFKTNKFLDISLGNLFFSSFFLKYKDFNLSLKEFTNFFDLNGNIFNITDGKNLYLHCLTSSGKVINEEADIIENKNKYTFDDLYLFQKKISKSLIKKINKKDIKFKKKYLKNLNYLPSPNIKALNSLKESDIIIYGPGTQFSSLFPSYLTKKLSKTLYESKAKKFLILNIFKDKDICNQTQKDILSKFEYFLEKQKNINAKMLYDYVMSHKIDKDDINNYNLDKYLFNDVKKNKKKIIYLDWEKSSGIHLPNLLIKNILNYSNKSKYLDSLKLNTVSIILPCLNEEKKLNKSLIKICNSNLFSKNLFLELLLIDGGSTDKSLQIAKKFKQLKIYSLKNSERGFAIDYGIKKAKGDIIAIFPTDDEYEIKDLRYMINNIINTQEKVIYGSRLIKCVNLSNQIKKVYKKNYFGYFISKYGGLLVSILTLILYNRFITDPFSTVKVFKASTIKSLKINSSGVDYDIEQFVKLMKKNIYIKEYPVQFIGRNYKDGKKIKIIDGLKCIIKLFKLKLI